MADAARRVQAASVTASFEQRLATLTPREREVMEQIVEALAAHLMALYLDPSIHSPQLHCPELGGTALERLGFERLPFHQDLMRRGRAPS